MSEFTSSVFRNLKEIIQEQEENIKQAIGGQVDHERKDSHVNSFNDGDDFIPDDRSTPVREVVQPCSKLQAIPETCENGGNPMNRSIFVEDDPIKPGVDGRNVKSFEELLELSMRNESLDVSRTEPETVPKKPIVKRTFLKKGQGIESRFKTKQILKRTCQLERQDHSKDTRTQPSQSQCLKKPMSTKTVNVLPRTVTRGRPVPKETFAVIGNPLKHQNQIVNHTKKVSRVTDTSLENLERLLLSVRSRKEELLRQPLTSSASSEEDSCWEEEEDIEEEEEELSDYEPTNKYYQGKKKVRWNDSPTKMSRAKTGVYTKSVRNYMASLENKLFELQERCSSRGDKKEKEQPQKVSQVNDDVMKEISDLRSQISVIADGIKTLQLYTSSLKDREGIKKKPQIEVPKVRITRELPVRESCTRNSTDERFEEDTNVKFGNGDQMQVLKDGSVIYTFSDGTLQTTFPDGSKVVEFKNGQIERTLVNGLKQITYPNKCQRTINPDGSEELIMADGTITRIAVDGTEVVILPNGEREIRSKQYSRREYKNGCVKTIYADGSQETRFPNGRLRIKDKNDKIIVDSLVRPLTQI